MNTAQAAAVASNVTVTVVRAGPGTGKTRVLVERARRAIREGERPVLVTFTRSAAREMLDRLGDDAGHAWAGTLHGLCAEVLARHPEHLPPGIPAEGWQVAGDEAAKVARAAGAGSQGEVRAALRASGLVTYDELLDGAAGAVAAGAWRPEGHLLIDEAQDLTAPEWALLRRMSHAGRFVVGDAAQAIFGWRGGRVDQFLAEGVPGAVLALGDNYRSRDPILDLANRLPVDGRVQVRAARSIADGPPVRLVEPERAVAWLRGRGPGGVAVLGRTRGVLREAKDALEAAGVPVAAPCLEDDVWSTPGALNVLAALHVAANPHDSLHLAALLRRGGMKPAELARIELRRAFSACSLYTALLDETERRPIIEAVHGAFGFRDARAAADVLYAVVGWGATPDEEAALEAVRAWWAPRPSGEDGPGAFLRWFTDPHRDPLPADQTDAALLSTIHGAKGREWEAVVVWGCEEGVLPMGRLDTDVAEERRLLYVAATRARDELVLVCRPDVAASSFLREAYPLGWPAG